MIMSFMMEWLQSPGTTGKAGARTFQMISRIALACFSLTFGRNSVTPTISEIMHTEHPFIFLRHPALESNVEFLKNCH
jgi:hypothetical protein